MIALLLVGCQNPHGDTKGGDSHAMDTGVDSADSANESDSKPDSDSRLETDSAPDTDTGGDVDTADSPTPDTCGNTYDTDLDYEIAAPCDTSLPWVQVQAGVVQTCGIKSDGCAQCWGAEAESHDFDIPDVPFASIGITNAAGNSYGMPHICGVGTDGALACWGGLNDHDQNVVPSGTYLAVSSASDIGAAIREDGSLQQWGRYAGCAPGPYTDVVTAWFRSAALGVDGSVELFADIDNRTPVDGVWSDISIGSQWVCGIRSDLDDALQCVDNDDGSEISLADLPEGRFIDVCATYLEACALDETGMPVCWGYTDDWNVLSAPPPGPFVAITCGAGHACALTAEGAIECWGDDVAGETIPPS